MSKVRIYDLAKELEKSPKEVLDLLSSIGVANKVASSSVEATAAASVRQLVANRLAAAGGGAADGASNGKASGDSNASNGSSTPTTLERPQPRADVLANGGSNGASTRPQPRSDAPAPRADADTRPQPRTEDGNRSDNRPQPRSDRPQPRSDASARPEARSDQRPRTGANRDNTNRDGANRNNAGRDGANRDGANRDGANRDNNRNNAPRSGGPNTGAPNTGAPNAGAPNTGGAQSGGGQSGGTQGGNRPAGNRPGGGPNSGGGNRPRGGGSGGRGGRGGGSAPASNAPQDVENSPFALGGRDRRMARRGKLRGHNKRGRRGFEELEQRVEQKPLTDADRQVVIPGDTLITVGELAKRMRKTETELIRELMSMGVMRSANQPLENDVASQIATRHGFTISREAARSEVNVVAEENVGELVDVPPVVVVMGHVDHGKTSLLDRIRRANVQEGEAGGITQRIGAYEAHHGDRRMVFLDTPGHEAFTRMRARGAHVTDMAVLVVAADDGVMPQTREAIDHARAAKVPIIVAMNKMDKPGADPRRIEGQLAEVGLVPESYGGETVIVPVSAKTGDGVDDLLEIIGLQADLLELKANPTGPASGTVIEARQDPNLGPVATVLLHRGTLEIGDSIVIGDTFGRVRQMLDHRGEALEEAGPKTPVFLTGLSAVPHASDTMRAYENAREAREAAEKFEEERRAAYGQATSRTLADVYKAIKEGRVDELYLIVKADGQGSVEALAASLEELQHAEVRVKIVSRGVGGVTENDVNLASATGAFIIAFAVPIDNSARQLADREDVEIRPYDVIYSAIDDVRAALEGMLKPVFEEKYSGEAEVRALFKSTRAGTIAGCAVLEGKMVKGGILRVERNKKQIWEGKLDMLRHYKEEVKDVAEGGECGISANGFNDFQEGDRLKCFVLEQIKRTLDSDS